MRQYLWQVNVQVHWLGGHLNLWMGIALMVGYRFPNRENCASIYPSHLTPERGTDEYPVRLVMGQRRMACPGAGHCSGKVLMYKRKPS